MPIGVQFSDLLTRLKDETGRSNDPAVGVDADAGLKQVLNRTYTTLYLQHEWGHLRKVFPKITLQAGERYYDFPVGLNPDRVEEAVVWYSGLAHKCERGIDFGHYNAYDPEDDERSEPTQRWDVRWTGTESQIEVWPLPSTNAQSLQFTGIQAVARLVNDSDVCLLDDDLVLLFAASEILARQKDADAEAKLSAAQEHLRVLKARSKAALQPMKMGLGQDRERYASRVTVRVR